jgi:RecA-family ATPase
MSEPIRPFNPFRQERFQPPQFLIESWLPSCEVSLFGGPSGSGKSRLLFDMLLRWQRGDTVFGKRSNPVPWIYVSADRSEDSVHRTLDSMCIDSKEVPLLPGFDMGLDDANYLLDEIQRSKAQLAVVEAYGSFVNPPGNSKCVKQFIMRCRKFMRETGTTILGVMESPKLKPFERYELARQRISGAAGWGHYSETIFLLEPTDLKNAEDPRRTLHICPRNGPAEIIELTFNLKGHLVPVKPYERYGLTM